MTTFASPTSPAVGRSGRTGRRPARWAFVMAHLVPLVTLPSGLWRLGLVFGASMGAVDEGVPMTVSGWGSAYVVGLTVVAEATALLTIGLVRPWGERAPGWMPLIGGKPVPMRPVVAVATLGAGALFTIWGGALLAFLQGRLADGFAGPGWEALFLACYAPLLLWAPLVWAVTFDFWRRRR